MRNVLSHFIAGIYKKAGNHISSYTSNNHAFQLEYSVRCPTNICRASAGKTLHGCLDQTNFLTEEENFDFIEICTIFKVPETFPINDTMIIVEL